MASIAPRAEWSKSRGDVVLSFTQPDATLTVIGRTSSLTVWLPTLVAARALHASLGSLLARAEGGAS